MAYSMADGSDQKKKGGSVKKTVRNFFSGAYHLFGERPAKSLVKVVVEDSGEGNTRRRHFSADDRLSKQKQHHYLHLDKSSATESHGMFHLPTLWPTDKMYCVEDRGFPPKRRSVSTSQCTEDTDTLQVSELGPKRNSADIPSDQGHREVIHPIDSPQQNILCVPTCEQTRRHSTGSGMYKGRHKIRKAEENRANNIDSLPFADDNGNDNPFRMTSGEESSVRIQQPPQPSSHDLVAVTKTSDVNVPGTNKTHSAKPNPFNRDRSVTDFLPGNRNDARKLILDSDSSLTTADFHKILTIEERQEINSSRANPDTDISAPNPTIESSFLSRRSSSESDSILSDEDFLQRSHDDFMRQISDDIVHDNTEDDSYGSDIVKYLQNVADDTRSTIALFLSTGKLESIEMTLGNLHSVFHVATTLNLKQLSRHCLQFCATQPQQEVMSCFGTCHCRSEIEFESKQGYCRSQSIISDTDMSLPPEYYIVFSRDVQHEDPNKAQKINVIVIDMSARMGIYKRDMDRPYQFGSGFQCCSCRIKESPFIAISGGKGKGETLLWKYDVLLNNWQKCARMLHGRSKHAMVCYAREYIYVLGGEEVPCIEKYSIKTNKWQEIASLAVHVHSTICVKYQRKIYLFGGKTPAGAVSSVQCFDVQTNSVEKLQDLPCPISGGRAVVMHNHIYIASGQGHMMSFNPETGNSHLCSQQPVQREHFGMFIKNDRIYLVGGVVSEDDDPDAVTPQYRYNPWKDTWVEKHKLCACFPVYASCIIRYPKQCSVVPFNTLT